MIVQRGILAGLLLALAAGAASAQAQRPQAIRLPSRWMLNAHTVAAFGTSVGGPERIQSLRTGRSVGGGVQVGYALTPRLTAFAGVDVTRQDSRTGDLTGDFRLTHLEVGARLNFPLPAERLVPYAMASVGRRHLSSNIVDLEGNTARVGLFGLSFGVGGGAQYFLSPTLALDGGVDLAIGGLGGQVTENGVRLPAPRLDHGPVLRVMSGVNWYH